VKQETMSEAADGQSRLNELLGTGPERKDDGMAHIKQVVEAESIAAAETEKRPGRRPRVVRRASGSKHGFDYPQTLCDNCRKWWWLPNYHGHKCIVPNA